ncbi:MAG: hypothetical protein ACJA08_002510 [Cyclobacteriaceae bacterium]|jgi:hypothetical protein
MRVWLSLVFLIPFMMTAQQRCGTDEIISNLKRTESTQEFSEWLSKKIKNKNTLRTSILNPAGNDVIYEVPVVFHLVHNGENIGSGPNLSEDKILEQLDMLNDDYGRQNADAINTPAQFLNVATDTEIIFVLARQDPEGLPTNGITRTSFNQTGFSDNDGPLLTSIIQWPPEDYINVYVANLTSSLGFAIFPFTDLSGLENEIENIAENDGIFLRYTYVGFNDNSSLAFTSYGRTLTHEMGHYLGLLHVFHNGCSGSGDYCTDTPAQSKSSLNMASCSAIPITACESGERPMIENYLDYSDDECMNLFTECQKVRMQTVLEYSPRRKSLLISHALSDVVVVANDLGIREIRSPLKSDCSASFTPAVQVRNYGSDDISDFKITVRKNEQVLEVASFNLQILPNETEVVSFDPISLNTTLLTDISFEIIEVNGIADGNSFNNKKSVTINASETSILPYDESFSNVLNPLARTEYGTTSQWQILTAPDSIALNKAAGIMFYNLQNEINYGVKDLLFTEVMDVSSLTSAQLTFKYAYSGRLSDAFLDELIVAVSTDCGTSFSYEDYIFSKRGNNLVTTTKTDNSFTPSSALDWEQIDINITPYLSSDYLQIGFIGVNGGGNNIYIDDINVTSANLSAYDVGIRRATNASLVTCSQDIYPTLNVRNFGYEKIDEIDVVVSANGASYVDTLKNLNIKSGESKDIKFTFNDLFEGENKFIFDITAINDNTDNQPENNNFVYNVFIDNSRDTIPIRQTFETDNSKWIINEISGEPLFEFKELSGRNWALKATAFNAGTVGSQSYLVSPNINTDNYPTGAIRFRMSHATRPGFTENLKILLSLDCGANYSIEVYNKNSTDITNFNSDSAWVPSNSSDWITEFVDISEYMIWKNLRVAFVFTNGQGNNLYLDDIELLTSNDPSQIVPELNVAIYPNPAERLFFLSFNLPEKQTVNMQLVDMTGKVIINQNFANALNQRYDIATPSQKGFYLVILKGPDLNLVKRLYIR